MVTQSEVQARTEDLNRFIWHGLRRGLGEPGPWRAHRHRRTQRIQPKSRLS